MAFVTRKEAALLLGVTPDAVYKAVREGRVSVKVSATGEVLLNSETMREEWLKNTDQRRCRIGKGVRISSTDAPQLRSAKERMAPRERRMGETKEAIPDYDDSRARTEHLKAELLELDRQQKLGRLVPVEDVEKRWVEIIVQARTKLLGLPTKAKQRIPDLDVDAIGTLDEIVRETLEELAAQGDEDSEEEVSQ